jgi:hypothetical protein
MVAGVPQNRTLIEQDRYKEKKEEQEVLCGALAAAVPHPFFHPEGPTRDAFAMSALGSGGEIGLRGLEKSSDTK